MPRTHIPQKPPSGKPPPTKQDLLDAIADVKGGMTKAAAMKKHGICCHTIGKYLNVDPMQIPEVLIGGRKKTFSKAQEKEIKDEVVKLSKTFGGLPRAAIGRIAFRTALKYGLDTQFQNRTAGVEWVISFLQRNEDLKQLILSVVQSPAEFEGQLVVNIREKYAGELTRSGLFTLQLFSLNIVQRVVRNRVNRMDEEVSTVRRVERGKKIVFLFGGNADGRILRPAIILPVGTNPTEYQLSQGPANLLRLSSETGSLTPENFKKWLNAVLLPQTQELNVPAVLIIQEMASLKYPDCYDIMEANNITPMLIPYKCREQMLPLLNYGKSTFYGALRRSFNDWKQENEGMQPVCSDLIGMLRDPFEQVITENALRTCFASCRIWGEVTNMEPERARIDGDEGIVAQDNAIEPLDEVRGPINQARGPYDDAVGPQAGVVILQDDAEGLQDHALGLQDDAEGLQREDADLQDEAVVLQHETRMPQDAAIGLQHEGIELQDEAERLHEVENVQEGDTPQVLEEELMVQQMVVEDDLPSQNEEIAMDEIDESHVFLESELILVLEDVSDDEDTLSPEFECVQSSSKQNKARVLPTDLDNFQPLKRQKPAAQGSMILTSPDYVKALEERQEKKK